MDSLLADAAKRAAAYLNALQDREVFPSEEAIQGLEALRRALPPEGMPPADVLGLLDEVASPATVASAGPRYFGFVTGGSLPAALAANWLAGAWDQNAVLYVLSPAAAALEEVAGDWLLDVLGLDAGMAVGFVSGATMANFSALAAARHHILQRAGWDVEAQGLFGAPEIQVVVGAEYHASMRKALSLVGFGRERVHKVPVDGQGRMIASELPKLDKMTILCAQAGNVNTGSFDPLEAISERAEKTGAWLHVDGAFGLWAKAAPQRAARAAGVERADSIAADAHKWLNLPYDSGLVFVRQREALNAAMTASAAYLIERGKRDGMAFVPEMSRRARGVEVWAALLSLGKQGLADLVERNCRMAARFAERLEVAGFEILNEVVLNQVLVSFGAPEKTKKVLQAVEAEGTLWAGGTEWQGKIAMRISVSSWATTMEDVDKSVEALIRLAGEVL